MRQFLAGLSLALFSATGIVAQEPQIVPDRYISLMRDTDLAGGDIQSIFDGSIRHVDEDVPFVLAGTITMLPDGTASIAVSPTD